MKVLEKLKAYLNGEIDNFELSESDKEVLALWIAEHEETDYEKLRKEVRDKKFREMLVQRKFKKPEDPNK